MASKKSAASSKFHKTLGTKPITVTNQKKKPTHSASSINFETFACLWLDADISNTQDNRETEQKLRKFINYLQTFNRAHDCEEMIRKIKKEKIILISSGQLGREIIPRIHDLPQLIACYIYCLNESEHQEWAKEYPKIQGVFVDQTIFLTKFNEDQKARLKAEELSTIKIVSNDLKASESRRAMFLWFQLYIEVLIRMHHQSNVKQELINTCKKIYKENIEELQIIDEFEKSYHPDRAIWWYTQECCFYRILNKALRTQDFDMLYTLRFFITDISKQLKQIHQADLREITTRDILQVYRGQAISMEELKLMQASVGKFLAMNSFISTSRKLSIAVKFLYNSPLIGDMKQILYEINIDPSKKTKAYAAITNISYYENEDEVLIMLGALLRIDQIEKNEEIDMWIAHVTLASDDDDDSKEILMYMKERIEQETNLASLGQILIEMGEYDQAAKYSEQMMHEAKLNEAKALEIKAKAAAFKNDCQTALQCSAQIMNIFNQIFQGDCQEKGRLYSSIGAIYCQQCTYKEALNNLKKALDIQRKVLPSNHPDICETYQHYANCYDGLDKIDMALEYYNKCLNMRSITLPKTHPAIAATYNDLGFVYERKRDFLTALEYYEKSLDISHRVLLSTHPEVQKTEQNIERLRSKIDN